MIYAWLSLHQAIGIFPSYLQNDPNTTRPSILFSSFFSVCLICSGSCLLRSSQLNVSLCNIFEISRVSNPLRVQLFITTLCGYCLIKSFFCTALNNKHRMERGKGIQGKKSFCKERRTSSSSLKKWSDAT